MRPAPRCAILEIEKGKATEAAYPQIVISSYLVTAATIRSSWRLFPFILDNLVNKTNKGNNEYTYLD